MFRRLNIYQRLVLVLLGAALMAFLVAGSGLLMYERMTLKARVEQVMEPFAQLVSVGTDAAIAFEDSERAQEVLNSLRASPKILAAAIVLDNGKVLASFGDTGSKGTSLLASQPPGIRLGDGHAELTQSLPRGGRLHLVMNLDQVSEQTQQTLSMFGAIMLVLAAATFGQIAVLRRIIIHPVTTLADTAEKVRTQGNYALRVPAEGTDEIARLAASFNAMLDAVQEREQSLRQATVFQRTILENAAYGIISTMPDGRVTSFNPAAERLLGYRAEEVIGKQTPVIWHDPDELARRAEELGPELGETLSPGFEVFVARAGRNLPDENEWTYIRRDGTRVPVLLSVTALRDDAAGLIGFVGLVSDLTERKLVEQELERYREGLEAQVATRTRELALARDAAESANRAKSDFLARMSHELRTPLNGILGYAQILKRKTADPQQLNGLQVIQQCGEQLLTLINDILDLAKVEAGRQECNPANISLRRFLNSLTEIVAVRAEQKGLAFVSDIPGDLPAGIRTDERLLRQALLNLLSNAVKYTDAGCVTLHVALVAPRRLRFAVEDTGIGVAADKLETIFKPFEQVGDIRRKSGGTGLGLAISREFVRMLGGEIRVESSLGQGSVFSFELTFEAVAPPEEAAIPAEPVTGYRGQRKTILVVDDVAENRAVIVEMLQPLGFVVVEATNGREGIDLALALKPDLVLMDSVMPEMDGNEATHRLKQIPGFKDLPVITISASAAASDRELSHQAGANAFLPKPFELDALLTQIATLLGIELTREPLTSGSPTAPNSRWSAPAQEDLAVLHRLALEGNMLEIIRVADDLQRSDEHYHAFADQLRRLASGFRADDILALVRQFAGASMD